MNHPPLCPTKTSWLQFQFTNQLVMICTYRSGSVEVTSTLFSCNRPHRVLIARHQACAWKDRADAYERLMGRIELRFKTGWTKHWYGQAYGQQIECLAIARAWREWEKAAQ